MATRTLLIFCMLIGLTGCGSSKLTQIPEKHTTEHIDHIAISPSGGVLADAISVALEADGYTIIDSAETTNLLTRNGLQETETYQPVALAALRSQNIDAILNVRTVSGYDNQPNSAVAKIISTSTGDIISGVAWQNGWGGREGSIADRNMRKGLSDTAREIAKGLEKNMSTIQ